MVLQKLFVIFTKMKVVFIVKLTNIVFFFKKKKLSNIHINCMLRTIWIVSIRIVLSSMRELIPDNFEYKFLLQCKYDCNYQHF